MTMRTPVHLSQTELAEVVHIAVRNMIADTASLEVLSRPWVGLLSTEREAMIKAVKDMYDWEDVAFDRPASADPKPEGDRLYKILRAAIDAKRDRLDAEKREGEAYKALVDAFVEIHGINPLSGPTVHVATDEGGGALFRCEVSGPSKVHIQHIERASFVTSGGR